MENQICEEMGNIFGAKRVWCRLIYSRKENKIDPTSQGFNENGNQQDEPLDNFYIESYDTPCNDHLCKNYERCTYKGMGYKCKCTLFKYGKPCISTKVCDKDSCKYNQTCPALEDCYKCDCNLFKLEQVCEYAGFYLLFSGLITFCTIAIFLFIFVGRRRVRRIYTFGPFQSFD
ncbi:uncharacterized protein LOC116307523 isoform X1 [Actinia tenebrosa]|uniref:Uncharacterized protein LOC116307523 isoform X1 n=1 Tax=Actinia tenebrosa TaxID=6105 RepID=A0A6P8J255_ACTTE|nr:uncharacterized protein LOC116307523 isoform X1 [Actinia tenebrosa]